MNVKKSRVSLLVAILTVALMFSLFSISAFAESSDVIVTDVPAGSEESVGSSEPAGTDAPVESGASTETSTPSESGDAAETGSSSTSSSTTASTTDGHDHDHDDENSKTDTIISLVVGGVIIVIIVIVCIIMREKLGKFLRSLKSEMKKIVWLPKDQTLKNTVIVLIIVAICAIVIGILDFAFTYGIGLLGKLF